MATQITSKAVLTINGKQVEETFNGLKRSSGQLERELKKLTPGTQEFIEKSKELATVNKRFTEVKNEINETKNASKNLNNETQSLGGTFDSVGERITVFFTNLLSGQITFKTLGAMIKVFAVESWAAISSIPVIGWVTAAVAGLGLLVKQVVDYNTELYEANKLTQGITKLQDEALDRATIKSQSIEQGLGLDRLDVLESARVLVKEFGITYDEALEKIKMGAIKGGAQNREYLDSIKEYPTFFAKAGFSAQEFLNIINAGADLGIYKDKLPDAIKEFGLSVTEQTKTASDALINAFGADFSKSLLDNVSKGKITVKDALVEINRESEKYNLSQKQQAQLTADLFKGAGEDAGGFQKVMDAVTMSIIEQNGELTTIQQTIKDQVDAYDELGIAKNDALKSDAVLALKREFEIFWIRLKAGFYNTIGYLQDFERAFLGSSKYLRGVFLSLPKAAGTAFTGILSAFQALITGLSSGGNAIALIFKGDFEGAKEEAKKFLNTLPNAFNEIKKSGALAMSDILVGGAKELDAFNKKYDARNKINAATQREIESRRENAGKDNSFDGTATPSKSKKDNSAKKAEAEAKKAAAERKKYADQIEKDDEDAKKQLLSNQEEYQKAKSSLIENEFLQEAQKEADRRNIESRKTLTEIADLEKKKLETRSETAKAEYQKSIDVLHEIEILNEDTHQKKLLAMQEKWDAISFEKFVQAEQKRITEGRRLAEDEINNISTMEEAELALSEMKYLKLTDQELKGIKTLEDAKRALREDADRKMLEATKASLIAQKDRLVEALKGVTGEAAEKIKANLDEIITKITQVQSAINGGTESDAKKVTEDNNAKKESVDIFGFSAKDWEDTFQNLDKTEEKIKMVGMVFTALSNTGKMFADLQKSLGERDLRRFEAQQNKKRSVLEKQLNEGYITQEDYNKQVQKIEAETANKKAELEYKQAKASKIANMFSIIGATAVGVARSLPNIALAYIVGALGAVQLGIAAAQPLPERPSFARGGFTGGGFGAPDSSGYRPAGIVHENEWIAPEWMLSQPRTAKIIDYLESVRQGKNQSFADGGLAGEDRNTTNSINTNSTATNSIKEDSKSDLLLSRVLVFLEYLIDNGVHIESSPKNSRELGKLFKIFPEIENKNKH